MGKLEYSDEPYTADEWLKELPDMVQAHFNSVIKGMAKRAKVKMSEIRAMPLGEFQANMKAFQKKFGLDKKFAFLED